MSNINIVKTLVKFFILELEKNSFAWIWIWIPNKKRLNVIKSDV